MCSLKNCTILPVRKLPHASLKITLPVLVSDRCNRLFCQITHRHRSPVSSQCRRLRLAAAQWTEAGLLFFAARMRVCSGIVLSPFIQSARYAFILNAKIPRCRSHHEFSDTPFITVRDARLNDIAPGIIVTPPLRQRSPANRTAQAGWLGRFCLRRICKTRVCVLRGIKPRTEACSRWELARSPRKRASQDGRCTRARDQWPRKSRRDSNASLLRHQAWAT